MAGTADGTGYMMVGANGGVYAFGDAHYAGSLPGLGIAVDNVVGLALSPDGNGYWMVSNDRGGLRLRRRALPRVAAGAARDTDTDRGHRRHAGRAGLLAGRRRRCGLRLRGRALPRVACPGLRVTPTQPITGIAATPDGKGYWMVGADGAIYAFGDAPYEGSLPGLGVRVSKPIIGMAPAGAERLLVVRVRRRDVRLRERALPRLCGRLHQRPLHRRHRGQLIKVGSAGTTPSVEFRRTTRR